MSGLPLAWNDLQYFIAVARHQQLTRAAHALRTSHVTVARHIDRLEHSLGVALFERGPKGYALTAQGQHLIEIAEEIESKTANLSQVLGDQLANVAGTIRMNMPEGFCHHFCTEWMVDFRRAFPQLAIEVVSIQQLASFTPNINDITVVIDPPNGAAWHSEKIADYSLHIYGHRDYLAAHGHPRSREDLLDHAFIGYINEMIFMPGLDYLAEVHSRIRPKLQFSSIFSQIAAVENRQGLAVMPDYLARHHRDLCLVLDDQINIRRSYWLACRHELRHAPREGQLMDYIVKIMKRQQDILLS